MMMSIKLWFVSVVLLLVSFRVDAQLDSIGGGLSRLSVEKDMLTDDRIERNELEVLSQMRQLEALFQSSASVSVLTADQLRRSGVSSIAEAMSLVPGTIVRQTTNGNYEVCLAGNDYAMKRIGSDNDQGSKIFLVMVNSVPVNNAWSGGVNWEGLPIDLVDIERIEVYRDPQSAAFGSEAIAGAVNIFTRKEVKNGVNFRFDAKGNKINYMKNEGSITAGINEKIKLLASYNYFSSRRFGDDYYVLGKKNYVPSDSLLYYQADAAATNKYTTLAIERTGFNIGLNYIPIPKYDFWLNVSHQDEKIQIPFSDRRQIMLNQTNQRTNQIDLSAQLLKARFVALYQYGAYDPAVGVNGYSLDVSRSYFELAYPLELKNGLGLYLGSNFQSVVYDNSSGSTNLGEVPVGRSTYSRGALYVNTQYQVTPSLRTLASVRCEVLPAPYNYLFNFQLSGTYLLAQGKQIRTSLALSQRPPYSVEIFANESRNTGDYRLAHVVTPFSTERTKHLQAGYRRVFNTKLSADVDLFVRLLQGANYYNGTARVDVGLKAQQLGGIASLNYQSAKLDASAYLCLQRSQIDIDGQMSLNRFTPSIYGGLYLCMAALYSKLNVSVNSYFFSNQYFEANYATFEVKSNVHTSFKVSYRIKGANNVYVNVKNLALRKAGDYPFADQTKVLLLFGVNIHLTTI